MGYVGMTGSWLTMVLMTGTLFYLVVCAVFPLLWIVCDLNHVGNASTPNTGHIAHNTTNQTTLRILQRRYTLGEIGRDEYERVRIDLLRDVDSKINETINKETT